MCVCVCVCIKRENEGERYWGYNWPKHKGDKKVSPKK